MDAIVLTVFFLVYLGMMLGEIVTTEPLADAVIVAGPLLVRLVAFMRLRPSARASATREPIPGKA
ncbi:MAG: hypothetical protein ACRD1X_06040 [Vicinamibacteria bacterium]